MIVKGGRDSLKNNLSRQLCFFWVNVDPVTILNFIPNALERLEYLLYHIKKTNKYVWHSNQEPVFTPMHSVQYAVFLFLLSNTLFKEKHIEAADAVYCLIKVMHSCDWFYAIDLPQVFYAEHPLGSVMGRAVYGNQFFFYQGCTIGGNCSKEGTLSYPIIGNNVLMFSNSSILGNAKIGNNVIISAEATIIGENILDNSMVFGKSPNLFIKSVTKDEIHMRQNHSWEKLDE